MPITAKQIDQVYSQPQPLVEPFKFDEQVATVFSDMINRSVPGYALMIDMIAGVGKQQVPANGVCYDLGCSLGAVAFALRKSIPHSSAKIVAVDLSPAMINKAEHMLSRMDGQVPINFVCADVAQIQIEPCDLVVMNFTLQFIAPELRAALIDKIYSALKPNGLLILSEKLKFDDADEQQFLTHLHHDFKRNQGYSDLEIAQKRTALENVLIADSAQTQINRLKDAGFSQAAQWFLCFNFASFIAQK